MKDYVKEGMASAKTCARAYGITDPADIAIIAKQFAYDLRRNDELRAMSEGVA